MEGFFLAPGHCKLKLSVCLFFFSFLSFSLSFSSFLFRVETSTAFLLTSVRLQSREQVRKDTGCPFRCYFQHHSLLRCYYVIYHGRRLHSALITARPPLASPFLVCHTPCPSAATRKIYFPCRKWSLWYFGLRQKSHLSQADLDLAASNLELLNLPAPPPESQITGPYHHSQSTQCWSGPRGLMHSRLALHQPSHVSHSHGCFLSFRKLRF